jgi:hypothetical protein
MRKLNKKSGNRLFGEGGRYAHTQFKKGQKAILITCLLLFITFPVFSQHNFVLYNNGQLPQASFENPGQEVWMNGYLILPGLSGAQFDLFSDGPEIKQMGLNSDFSLNNISPDILNSANNLSGNAESTILGFGFRQKAGFFHFKLQEHFTANINYPQSLFELIENYNAEATSLNNYRLDPLSLDASHYRSYTAGYTHRFKKLSLGANIRYLQGIANVNIHHKNLDVIYSKDDLGYSVQGYLQAFTAGTEMYKDPKTNNFIKGSGNSGFAVDLGGVIHFSPKFEMSFAAQNLGKLFWKNHIHQTMMLDETTVFQAKDSEEFSEELESNFTALFDDEIITSNGNKYQTNLRQKYLLGTRYFFTPSTNMGLLFHTDVWDGKANFGGSLSLNTQYKEHIGFSLAVSKYQNENFDLGTGINFNLGPVQIYAMTDNLISLISKDQAHKLHGQAGINFIFGKKTRRNAIVCDGPVIVEPAPAAPVIVKEVPVMVYPEPEFTPRGVPVQPVVEAEDKETEALPDGYIQYRAQVSDAETNKSLHDVKVNVYKLKSRQIQVLVHSEMTKNGYFSIPISRVDTHRVVIEREGFHKLEKEYSQGILDDNSDTLTLYFFLIPTIKDPEVLKNTVKSTLARLTDFSKGGLQDLSSIGSYRMIGSTSLRYGPHHTEGVILRLREGDEISLLEKTSVHWWRVKYGGLEGYVKASFLEAL